MQQIPTEEFFSAPQSLKIICYFFSIILLFVGIDLLRINDAASEVLFLVPLIFLITISMFIYTRLKLIISNTGVRFVGGLKQHSFSWNEVKKVDMIRVGKYKTPIATIHYSKRTLDLHKGFYLNLKFNRILSLLEMKIDPGLFTEEYRAIRRQTVTKLYP